MTAPVVNNTFRTPLDDPEAECWAMEWWDADLTTRVRVNNNGFPAWCGQLWERLAERAVQS